MIDKDQWWEFGQCGGLRPYSLREVPWAQAVSKYGP